jgi:O-methyltransferase
MKSLLSAFANRLSRRARAQRYAEIYDRFRDSTMVPESWFHDNLALAETIRPIAGCVVECGVWRGGMSAALATLLGPGRHCYLFDSFQGLPPAREIDGQSAIDWQQDTGGAHFYNNCAAPQQAAAAAMARSGTASFTIVPGWFADTLPGFDFKEPIALLRLDGDWYDSTMTCLEACYDKLADGAITILDDYTTWDGCSRAVHDFFSRRKATERIRTRGEVAYFIKMPRV